MLRPVDLSGYAFGLQVYRYEGDQPEGLGKSLSAATSYVLILCTYDLNPSVLINAGICKSPKSYATCWRHFCAFFFCREESTGFIRLSEDSASPAALTRGQGAASCTAGLREGR